ncbi:hypothetical protein A3D71_03590 [Candidatus Kaiserbacteria bacterium RIFCSPHIGHO2_02_FULL_55_20]|uniref:Uncharacterized protein n=1 Tax=Candidatus Kaiserbacteria bacterium RIFCSPHIGHO2_02_FULL_55_20 TaxID=1798497 RepID=A0A1F6DVD6_9BACT|nr:MAG: hypothetical protein A2680_04405 [Candidatus Kaiserbacteria bacterium RIFCSPHIGHO2_01_FULL_55_37]OGG65297.1 MAG: hypothetical protein A3D71_03590 [Candidatus Kaiserbacteria bacterium RIFCSPHIGHO2_02_FULL_55_20]
MYNATSRLRLWVIVAAALFFAAVSVVYAQENVVSAYRQLKDVPKTLIRIVVPTVVEVPLDRDFLESYEFAVQDTGTNRFEPSYFLQTNKSATFTAVSNDTTANVAALADNDPVSYASFEVPGNTAIRTVITLTAAVPVTSSALTIALADNVALPVTIAIRASDSSGPEKVVVSERTLDSTAFRFPQTRARSWVIELTHVQPLRIRELQLAEDNVPVGSRSLRFLAQPDHSYRIYFNADRSVVVPSGESGNLADSRNVRRVAASVSKSNPGYIPADSDSDGIPDTRDNCVSTANADQADIDGNGLGDVCEDFDRDGIPNVRDNCPDNPNVNQADADSDGVGDICDKEESRLTEKYAWIPWAGIGFAALVIVALFALTARSGFGKTPTEPQVPSGVA